ncbi:MAG: ATP-grasp domain-containing protein [Pseudomonadota bacterium]
MHIVYPGDYFKPKQVDELYRDEASAFSTAGWSYSAINVDELENILTLADLDAADIVMYRGWMLNETAYRGFTENIQRVGAKPLTSAEDYLSSHHLPNWYPKLQAFTAETVFLSPKDDLVNELSNLNWPGFFIKDHVKSLKTSVGSAVTDISMINTVVAEMEKFRGTIEGGLCIRRLEEYIEASEQRYFVINGTPHSAIPGNVPDIVYACAKRLDSPFYSIDIAERIDGELRVVEIGDGQVSDLVGWGVERFVEVCLTAEA